ncbi:hypothetical protein JTB14_021928 [Gonioctena quinquepunctata]|nr:hypothetical protein JTB14_021928 [Gonioctena quinquepunctata]
MVKMMYILVRFICDGIFHVNANSEVKIQKKKIKARYGRYWYEADIICKNRERSILQDICHNLNFKHLYIDLTLQEVKKRIIPEVSLMNTPSNTEENNLAFEVLLDGQSLNISPNTTYVIEPLGNLYVENNQDVGTIDNNIQETKELKKTSNYKCQ